MDGNLIVIKGQWASKKNSKRIAGGKIIASANWMQYHDFAKWQLSGQELPMVGKCKEVKLTFFPKDKRRRDLTNGAEGIMDILVEFGVFDDDSMDYVPKVVLEFGGIDKINPRVHIDIVP